MVEFYNYYEHLEKFKFEWENEPLEFKYSVELSTDKSQLTIKKWQWEKKKRKLLFIDESRIWNSTSFAINNHKYLMHGCLYTFGWMI